MQEAAIRKGKNMHLSTCLLSNLLWQLGDADAEAEAHLAAS